MPKRPQRRNSLRYDGYDYTSPGAYAITICAYQGQCIFGEIIEHEMILNPLGRIADERCRAFGERHARIDLNAHVVMPNHVHILFTITTPLSQPSSESTAVTREFGKPIAGSVSAYMGGYKSSVKVMAKHRGLIADASIWQDQFYDRIVRNEKEFQRHYDYIQSNPARWLEDQPHPDAPLNKFNAEWRKP